MNKLTDLKERGPVMFYSHPSNNTTRGGNPDCGQGNESNDFENGYNVTAGGQFANIDDFHVSAGNSLNVLSIELNLMINAGDVSTVDLTFYNDEGGSPGSTVVATAPGLVPYAQPLIGSAFGYQVRSVFVDVDLTFEGGASGTSFWMQPEVTTSTAGTVFWEVTTAGSLGAAIHSSDTDEGGAWVVDEEAADGVFTLHCEHAEAPTENPCPFGVSSSIEPITRVVFAGIDNSSSATVDGTPALEDFTDMTGTVTQGESYPIAAEGNTAGDWENYFVAFIDWNQNGNWDDPGERYVIGSITNSTGTDGLQATGTISVPANAALGTTTMRVIKNFNTPVDDACSGISWGQGEDYTILVEEGDGGPGPTTYCEPLLDCTDGDVIFNVTFLEINNTTGCGTNGYSDFTDMVANITPGESHPISVSVGDGWTEHVSVWIDFDNSGTFDQNEFTYVGSGDGSVVSGSIEIPASLGDGNYRMRVRVAAVTEATATWDMACDEDQGYGETEDYTVNVGGVGIAQAEATDFSFYPNPVNDVLTITTDSPVKELTGYNMVGQHVFETGHLNGNKVNFSALPTGMYLFKALLNDGSLKTFKITKD